MGLEGCRIWGGRLVRGLTVAIRGLQLGLCNRETTRQFRRDEKLQRLGDSERRKKMDAKKGTLSNYTPV